MMAQGFEVVIRYRGKKHNQVASPTSPASEFAVLKRDLARLRVHSPSQKNVRRVGGSFVLHWPSAPSQKGNDSLYTRWFKLCGDDPEVLKLRELLSIKFITMKQDGILIGSTPGAVLPTQDLLPDAVTVHVPAEIEPATLASPADPPPLPPPPPSPPQVAPAIKHPPTAPRADREQQLHKRRRTSSDNPPSYTRPKPDAPYPRATSPAIAPADSRSTEPESMDITPPREPGEVTPRSARIGTPPGPRSASVGSGTGSSSSWGLSGPRVRQTRPASLYQKSSSSGGANQDVNRLTRELWDTRRQLAAMRAREQTVLEDLKRLGGPVPGVEGGVEGVGSGEADQNQNEHGVSREDLQALEAELKDERARRIRAESILSDVERECKTPFIVPALFQAFISISELSS